MKKETEIAEFLVKGRKELKLSMKQKLAE